MPARISRAGFGAAAVDPEPMTVALERMADFQARRRRRGDMQHECAAAGFAVLDIDPPASPDDLAPDDLPALAAGAMSPDAMNAAAATARMTVAGDDRRVQPRDLVASAARADSA